eukprot:scaffold16068_cov113-Isochrysis_galbana.AAC.5
MALMRRARRRQGGAGRTRCPARGAQGTRIRSFVQKFRCRPPYGMTEAYKFSNARQARASESNLRILFSTLPPFRSTTASVAAHARSPSLAQRAAARPCRLPEMIEQGWEA